MISLGLTSFLRSARFLPYLFCLSIKHCQQPCCQNVPFLSLQQSNVSPSDVVQWSNHRVMEWLRSVDLAEYAPNLRGSGVHGGLIVRIYPLQTARLWYKPSFVWCSSSRKKQTHLQYDSAIRPSKDPLYLTHTPSFYNGRLKLKRNSWNTFYNQSWAMTATHKRKPELWCAKFAFE